MMIRVFRLTNLIKTNWVLYFSVSMLYCFLFVSITYSAPGDIDYSFGNGGWVISEIFTNDSHISDLKILPDGKIIALGSYFNQFAVARYLENGMLDASFGVNGKQIITFASGLAISTALTTQADGKIVVVGSARGTSRPDFAVARLNANGSIDSTFGSNGRVTIEVISGSNGQAYDVALQPDGKLLIVGQVSALRATVGVVRLLTNGSLDPTFGNNGIVTTVFVTPSSSGCYATSLLIDVDGKIVVGGNQCLIRYLSTGALDDSFGQQGIVEQGVGVVQNIFLRDDRYVLGQGFTDSSYDRNGNSTSFFDREGSAPSATFPGFNFESGEDNVFLPDGSFVGVGMAWNYIPVYIGVTGLGDPRIYLFGNRSTRAYSVAVSNNNKIVIGGNSDWNFSKWTILRLRTKGSRGLDFDGDGRADISIFRPNVGEWWYLKSSTGGNGTIQFGNSSDKITPGDFTGDRKTDIAFWRPSTGFWFVLRSEDSSFFSFPFGAPGDIPAFADYDGDGKTDASVFRPSVATWFILRSSDGGTTISSFGTSTDKPVPADYDGDGKADIAIFRPSVGEWWYAKSSTGQTVALQFGSSTDKPVPGDYTGDGKVDIAFFRPSTGFWFILRSEDNSFFSFPFGTPDDIPTPGDYDGDGKFDTAVFRPSNSTWFLNQTTAGVGIITFGISGDQPVPNAFVP